MYLIYFYVPEEDKEAVKAACFAAGAGRFRDYSNACWETRGTGQFLPLESANPHIGEQGRLEKLSEYKVEMICADADLEAVIAAIRGAHPYEEPAYGAIALADAATGQKRDSGHASGPESGRGSEQGAGSSLEQGAGSQSGAGAESARDDAPSPGADGLSDLEGEGRWL